jgi:hypothetical protein
MKYTEKVLSKNGLEIKYAFGITGKDIVMTIGGGQEHIGTVVLAIPRPSLDGSGKVSSTVSVMNVIGHKDEDVARPLAEALCKAAQRPAVVIAGIHYDDIGEAGIETVKKINDTAVSCVEEWLKELERKGED